MFSRNDNIQTQKFASLSFSFLFKAMECICYERCSSQYCDFVKDDENWFSLQLYNCKTLRNKVIPTKLHGWFSIDISIKDSKMESKVIEKWSLLHVPYSNTETLPEFQNIKDLKVQTYRNFSLALRSLYSIINVLPAKALSITLRNLKDINKPYFVADVSSWKGFPASLEGFKTHRYSQFKLPLIKTPVGKILVVCKYRTNIQSFIPVFIVRPSEITLSSNKTSDTYFQSSCSYEISIQCSCEKLSPFVFQTQSNIQSFIPYNNANFDFIFLSNKSIDFPTVDSVSFFDFIDNFQDIEYNENYEINTIIKEFNYGISLLNTIIQNT